MRQCTLSLLHINIFLFLFFFSFFLFFFFFFFFFCSFKLVFILFIFEPWISICNLEKIRINSFNCRYWKSQKPKVIFYSLVNCIIIKLYSCRYFIHLFIILIAPHKFGFKLSTPWAALGTTQGDKCTPWAGPKNNFIYNFLICFIWTLLK